jgi:PAS domain S-box-containing protein
VEKPFHPEDQQRAWDAWQHAIATNGTYSLECRLRRVDGTYRWWLIRGVPQQDSTGNILKWYGTCTDIHDLKLAELEISHANQALRDSDEKFRELADNIADVFWITSPDLKTMHYVSAGYERIWGRSVESLYANPHQWIETIIPEERESVFALFGTLMGTAPEVSAEYRIARPDGMVRWIHDRGFQVRDALGKLVRLTGIASDITQRKKLETQLSQAQKIEAIGTLAGGIAHDFNNILAAIMGYAEMAQRGISQDSRAQSHLEQVLIASTRAKDLVMQILTFSRSEEPDRKALELQPIIAETLKLLRASLPSTVEIRQNIDNAAPSVLGDATQFQQVMVNLCVNAAQAMKEHGVLEVRLTCLEIDHDFASTHSELKEGSHLRLDVSDTGCGMDHATRERIFEPFFTTKGPGEGTGLGLAVVHGVIKNHGGAIAVLSEPGVGTTFSIYLPVYERLQATVIHESDPLPLGYGEHILFVDDEEALVSLGKSMLEELGYRVTTKTDSSEALAAFRSQPQDFELVITDQTMPHLTGADLATALLEIRPTLPIIMVTGYSTTMSPEKAKVIGIGELLFKPYTMQALGEAIRRALDQNGKG